MTDLATRLKRLDDQVRPLGGQVIERFSFDPDAPAFAGFLSVDGDHSPLLDIPQGFLVVGSSTSEIMLRHRVLMTSTMNSMMDETGRHGRHGVRRVWEIAAGVAQRAEQGGGGPVFIAASLPPRRHGAGPSLCRGVQGWASTSLDPRLVETRAMDLVCSLLDHREDLDLAQWREHLDLYVARPWPAGEPDPVRPWEVSLSAPGGNLLGWKIPEAAVQSLVDDALDLQNERSHYQRLAGRI